MVIPLLQAIQEEFSYLPSEALERLYQTTEVDRAQVISVSTFYSQFRHAPFGEHIIKICTGTACHVKGAPNVYDAFVRQLGIAQGSVTTDDMRYSVEKVACLGCCTLAPVVQIVPARSAQAGGEKTYGHVAPGKVAEVLADFEALQHEEEQRREQRREQRNGGQAPCEVRLGVGSCCMASGSADIYKELLTAARELDIEVNIKPVGCVGVCSKVPLIDVVTPDGEVVRYPNVKAIEIKEILHHHFQSPKLLKRIKNKLLNSLDTWHTDITWDNVVWKSEEKRTKIINSFLEKQLHISTEGYGKLSPLSIDEYKAMSGFSGLHKALEMERSEVVKSVLNSGIRGRGGGGFSTGKKWEMVAAQQSAKKYIICNGDEGDPGAFMDRMLLESYPFRVIEGMIIGAYAVGASEGYFYIRAEYPLAVKRIRAALELCRESSLLGKSILGSNFSFDIKIFEGAGAFVCGEETALIASIEGERGFPRQRPPFPAQKGLFGFPTLVNNVETLSQIPYIIRCGAQGYAAVGADGSSGTKVFALAGKVRNGGLIEVPMGITLNEIVHDIGGGVGEGRTFKAVQIGGPSGGCIPAALCDTKVSFDAFTELGAMMGSGGLVALDDRDCMVDMARYFLTFTCEQSCGKCTFCRVGIRRMLDLLEKICHDEGSTADLDNLEKLARAVKSGSACGLGKTAPNPVLTTLKYFREEYEAHINGVCPTGTCREMTALVVNDRCIGCTKCAKACPVDAIEYLPYEKHSIDVTKCTLCGLCIDECKFDAIEHVGKKKAE